MKPYPHLKELGNPTQYHSLGNAPVDPNALAVVQQGLHPKWQNSLLAAANGAATAVNAPKNALLGNYDQVEIGSNGSVSPFDPRMMQDASSLAGMVTLGAGAVPAETGAMRAGLGAMPIGKPEIPTDRIFHPNLEDLHFRENMQNRTSDIVDELGSEVSYWPSVVAINDDGKLSILDGHNRAAVAKELGAKSIPTVAINRNEYETLQKAGYDDMEIAYAALTQANDHESASNINRQFPGAKVAERGTMAWTLLP